MMNRQNYAMLLLFLSLAASAGVPETCSDFSKNVLSAAVTEREDEMPQFVKDEKKAIEFIKKYDPEKLGLDFIEAKWRKALESCEAVKSFYGPSDACDKTLFPNYYFLQALIERNDKTIWSTSTKDLGRDKAFSFLRKIANDGYRYIDLSMAFSLLNQIAKENPSLKLPHKEILAVSKELEEVSKAQHSKVKDGQADCKTIQAAMKSEAENSKDFAKKLQKFVGTR